MQEPPHPWIGPKSTWAVTVVPAAVGVACAMISNPYMISLGIMLVILSIAGTVFVHADDIRATLTQRRWDKGLTFPTIVIAIAVLIEIGIVFSSLSALSHPLASAADLRSAMYRPPKLLILGVKGYWMEGADRLMHNVIYENQGDYPVMMNDKVFIAQIYPFPISALAQDEQFRLMDETARFIYVMPPDRLFPGLVRFATFPPNPSPQNTINHAEIAKVKVNAESLYLMGDFIFIDTRDDSLWHTETCQHYDFRRTKAPQNQIGAQNCVGHNGTAKLDDPLSAGALTQ